MITKVNNAQDALQAFNENLDCLLTGKRKLPFVKEVNNTLGKMCNVVKMQLLHKHLVGDKTHLAWFTETKQIEMPNNKKLKKAI